MSSLTEHPADLFYQKEEYAAIRDRVLLVAQYAVAEKQLEEQQLLPQDPQAKKICTRGLEYAIEGPSNRLYLGRQCVSMAQQRQRDEGTYDDEALVLSYRCVSEASAAVARERALNDAKEVEGYYSQ